MHWSHGYNTETQYVSQFYRETSPSWLDAVCITQGVRPPQHNNDFRWCELGSANGFTVNLIAAAYPDAHCVGIDFMPLHYLNSESLRSDAGLNNAEFHELSFEEACDEAFEPFDYIVMHGIYSWVSEENRAQVRTFIRKFLKPGGVVYNSYNCLPGWSESSPLRHYLMAQANSISGSNDEKAHLGLSTMRNLADNAGKFFQSEGVKAQLDEMQSKPINYISQEYMNQDWTLFYVDQVMAEMDEAKLNYVGSTKFKRNHLALNYSVMQERLIASQPTLALQELTKDFIDNTQFRADVMVRGAVYMGETEQAERLASLMFAEGRSKPQSLADTGLTQEAFNKGLSEAKLIPLASRQAISTQFNEVIRQRTLRNEPMPYVLLTAFGTGIATDKLDILLADKPIDDVLGEIEQNGTEIEDRIGRPVTTREAQKELLENYQAIREDELKHLKEMGVYG